MAPTVTVLLPAHNASAWLDYAIASILGQTFHDLELWVLENGSTDDTARKAKRWGDSRIRVFELGPIGFQQALVFGLENCTSTWIARMDADDVSFPTRLERQMKVIDQHPGVVMVGTAAALLTRANHIVERVHHANARYFGKDEVAVGRPDGPVTGRFCVDPSMLFNRARALAVGGYDPEFTMGDVPLWFRMLADDAKGWEIADPLYAYRLSPSSLSRTHTEGVRAREKYAPELADRFRSVFHLKRHAHPQIEDPTTMASYWRHMTILELISGDIPAASECADSYKTHRGRWLTASKLSVACGLGKLGVRSTRFRYRQSYRHRPDLERPIRRFLYTPADHDPIL